MSTVKTCREMPGVKYTKRGLVHTARIGQQVARDLDRTNAGRQCAALWFSSALGRTVPVRDVAIYASADPAFDGVAVHCPVSTRYRAPGLAAAKSSRRRGSVVNGSIADALFGEISLGSLKLARGGRQ